MGKLTDTVQLFAGNQEDRGGNPISFGINVTLQDSSSRLEFEYFGDFLCDNLQGGKSTTFHYSKKIVITQSDYSGRDLHISDNSESGNVVTISVPRNVKVRILSRILAYSDQLADLRNEYCVVACPAVSPYYETRYENRHGIIGYKTSLNFIIEPLSSSLTPMEKELGIDVPKHFQLPVRLQPQVTNPLLSKIYAERLIFRWFDNRDVVVDFYLDTGVVDDSYKFSGNGELRVNKEIYGEATDQLGDFLSINPQFIPMQFIVIKSGGHLYFFVVDQGDAWDISDWVKGCNHVL